MLTALAATAAVGFTGCQVQIAQRQAALAEDGHITARYTEAVGQLGDPNLDVRVGGIYALERLSLDSPADRPTIIEVLHAYVRNHALLASDPICTSSVVHPPPIGGVHFPPEAPDPPSDLGAALSAIGRDERFTDNVRLDFSGLCMAYTWESGVNFQAAAFEDANLTGAFMQLVNFNGAQLPGANLTDASLHGDFSHTNMTRANLHEANFSSADMTNATFFLADLSSADFIGTRMPDADLVHSAAEQASFWMADLTGASFRDANLAQASFEDADLDGANFTGANIEGANFTGANVEGADFTDAKSADLTGSIGEPKVRPPSK